MVDIRCALISPGRYEGCRTMCITHRKPRQYQMVDLPSRLDSGSGLIKQDSSLSVRKKVSTTGSRVG